MPLDVTKPPPRTQDFEVFSAVVQRAVELFPELDAPGEAIEGSGSPSKPQSEQTDGNGTDATGEGGRQ